MTGQIVKILSNNYFVRSADGVVYQCNARGKFRIKNIVPAVGDYVEFSKENNYILDIMPRKNLLIRPQVSNIDQALIITSLKEPDFSSVLLDKLILVMEHNNVEPIICITKEDLLLDKDKDALYSYIDYYKHIGYRVLSNTDLESVKMVFKNKTTVMTGQTGSGKSTLLNRIDASLQLETGEISKALGRGKHTTRFVQLLELYEGSVLDTPGFSLIDLHNMSEEDIKNGFIEFRNYTCRFKNCRHINESNCSVKENFQNGNILRSRYENYTKFINEK